MNINALVRKYMPHWSILGTLMNKVLLIRCNRFLLEEKEIWKAEANAVNKKQILDKCQKKWKAEYSKVKKEAELKLHEFDVKKQRVELIEDAIFSHFAYGFSADEYFAFELMNKSVKERKSYISDQYRNKLAIYLNDYFLMEIFLDKYKTYLFYSDTYKREVVRVFSERDWEDYSSFYDHNSAFIKKRVDMARGNSVEVIYTEGTDDRKREIFHKIVNSGKCVLEEIIEQKDALACFHPASVNTIRVVSIWKDGKIEIPYCILRTGRGKSVIDNASAGGISAAIDPQNGVIITDGMDERNHTYIKHPDSGVAFKGYVIPDWEDLLSFIYGIVTRYPGIVYIGWDLAYSKRGWCLVEGNHAPQLEARQVLCGGMKEEFDRIVGRSLN